MLSPTRPVVLPPRSKEESEKLHREAMETSRKIDAQLALLMEKTQGDKSQPQARTEGNCTSSGEDHDEKKDCEPPQGGLTPLRRFLQRRRSRQNVLAEEVRDKAKDGEHEDEEDAFDVEPRQVSFVGDLGDSVSQEEYFSAVPDEPDVNPTIDYMHSITRSQFSPLSTSPSSFPSDGSVRPSDPVLTPAIISALTNRHLPQSLRLRPWSRLYSLQRDGTSPHLFDSRASRVKESILAVRCMDGKTLGCFVSDPWIRRHGFYGTGQSFIFEVEKSAPSNTHVEASSPGERRTIFPRPKPLPTIRAYHWTRTNDYLQASPPRSGLSIGSSPEFAFFLSYDFSEVSSSPCETFGNPSMVEGGSAQVLDVELWGFVT